MRRTTKSPRGQAATGELNDPQQDEEIAQEQLCNSRDRHDKDVPEMRGDHVESERLSGSLRRRLVGIAEDQV